VAAARVFCHSVCEPQLSVTHILDVEGVLPLATDVDVLIDITE